MSHATRVHDLFGGTLPLLRSKLSMFWKVPLVLGVVPGFLGALYLRLRQDQITVAEDLGALYVAAFLVIAFFSPVVAAENFGYSLSGATGAGRRQQDLLAHPLGRFAMPVAHLVAAVVVFWLWTKALFVGMAPVLDERVIADALGFEWVSADKRLWIDAFWAPAIFALGFTLSAGGGTFAVAPLLWAITAFLVWVMIGAMGHHKAVSQSAGAALLMAFTVAYILVPFALHARGSAHWSVRRGGGIGREGRELALVFTVAAAVIAYAALGFGWTLLVVIVLGGLVTWSIHRRIPRTPRRVVHGTRYAFVVLLVVTVPLLVLGAVLDARLVAAVNPSGQVHLSDWRPSPDGRHLVVELGPRRETRFSPGQGITRVALLDLDGGEPLLLPARFAHILGWSVDGRYLAVADLTLGRLSRSWQREWGLPSRDLEPRNALVAAIDPWLGSRTVIIDTATNTVQNLADPWVVTRGWRSPADLVRYRVDAGTTVELTDREGRKLSVQGSQGDTLRFLAYDEGELVFELARYEPNVNPTYEHPYHVSQVFRWTQNGLVEDDSMQRLAWRPAFRPATAEQGGAMHLDLTLELGGDEQLQLEGVYGHLLDTGRDRAILISDAEGLKRVSLPDGEQHLLRAGEVHHGFWPMQYGFAGKVLVHHDQQYWLLETEGWTFSPVRFPGTNVSLLSVMGDRMVGLDTKDWSLQCYEADGSVRQLLGPR